MKQPRLMLVSIGLALCATGCGSSIEADPGEGTVIDRGATLNQILTPDTTGWIARSATGTTAIQGQWRAFEDSAVGIAGLTAGSCQTDAYGECSSVREPAPGAPYGPTAGLGMCASGVIARWIAVSGSHGVTPDGSGGSAGIVLDLNTPDWPEPRRTVNVPPGQPYDAVAHGVIGFAFDSDMEPAPGATFRVEMATAGHVAPDAHPVYWRGSLSEASPVHAGHNEFRWDDVGPGAFSPRAIVAIRFVVSGNEDHAVSYDFCIGHLTALRGSGDAPASASFANLRPRGQGQPLEPDAFGWVDRTQTGRTHIQGFWFAVADGMEPNGDPGACQAAGHTDCSFFSEPAATGAAYPPTPDQGMCTSGAVAKTLGDGSIWGSLIAFILNAAAFPERGTDPYDAELNGVTGFGFEIDAEPPPGGEITVGVETLLTQGTGAFWGGKHGLHSPVHAGYNEFRWEDVGGPWWLPAPPPLDVHKLHQLVFHVDANATHAVSFGFCIKHLTALRD